jgi:hypothetical protein
LEDINRAHLDLRHNSQYKKAPNQSANRVPHPTGKSRTSTSHILSLSIRYGFHLPPNGLATNKVPPQPGLLQVCDFHWLKPKRLIPITLHTPLLINRT